MKEQMTAIFDIGKTNKKFFLFDNDFNEVYREYKKFDLITDEDGYPCENLIALQEWLKDVFYRMLANEEFEISAINFSTYGASLVHLGDNGEVLTPLYNYTKPINDSIVESFYKEYGPEIDFSMDTGTNNSGMLNSGLQLYWLKHSKPEIFRKIKCSLHLPQYVSYIFTGIPLSEYTSIGCHTALWDYKKKDYHDWVYEEEIHKILPPIVSTETSINMNFNGKRIKIGIGIHDSSSALLTYIRGADKSFLLVSTGTWSIALNPFAENQLSENDVKANCINYMRINSKPVKASRLFLGNEYKIQVKKLCNHYKLTNDFHKKVKFNKETYFEIVKDFEYQFKWESIKTSTMPKATKIRYDCFEHAYHQLMTELVLLQVESIKTALDGVTVETLYIDGGFTDNEIYIQLLSHYLRNMELKTTKASLGSAIGAAICISDTKLNSKFLKKNYSLKKHIPVIAK